MAESVTFIFTVSDGVTYFTVAESATFIFLLCLIGNCYFTVAESVTFIFTIFDRVIAILLWLRVQLLFLLFLIG